MLSTRKQESYEARFACLGADHKQFSAFLIPEFRFELGHFMSSTILKESVKFDTKYHTVHCQIWGFAD